MNKANMPGISIRPMISDDLPKIMEIEKEVFTDPWQEEMFIQEIEAESSYLLETTEEKEIIGYICGLQILDEYMITNIAVRNDYQGKGYGTELLSFLIKKIAEDGAKTCFLEVRKNNSLAVEFYHRHGFEIIGLRKAYYRDPVDDALLMKLVLN